MKTALTYGFSMALANALFTLLLYFTGFHDSAEKMKAAQWIGTCGVLAITVTCLALAMREKRATAAPEADWGYGSAFGVGLLTGLFAALFGVVFAYLYFQFINPGFSDLVLEAQIAQMEARGMSAAQIERAEPMMRKWMSPAVMTIMGCISTFIMSLILALIVAIFFRRREIEATAPPPIAA